MRCTAHRLALLTAISAAWGCGPAVGNEAGGVQSESDGNSVGSVAALDVQVGVDRTCALGVNMRVYCWGFNTPYDSDTTGGRIIETPEPMPGLEANIVEIAVGLAHACALDSSGTVMCWGNNFRGQLGTGTELSSIDPVPVLGLPDDIIAIAAAMKHVCALDVTGDAYCWGNNEFGQLGVEASEVRTSSVPLRVQAVSGPLATISAGYECSCATRETGAFFCWGDETCSLLDESHYVDGGRGVQINQTGEHPGFQGVTVVWGGTAHLCSVDDDGNASCRGGNDSGQLGDGTTVSRETPVLVQQLGRVAQVSGFHGHSCAVGLEGQLFCWGDNATGALGVGMQATRSSVPLNVVLPPVTP